MSASASEASPAPSSPLEEIPELVAQLRATFDSGKTRPLAWRREQLQGLIAFAKENGDRLVEALQADLGKPELEARSADLAQITQEAKRALKNLKKWTRPEGAGRIPLLGRSFVVREPLGVVLIIAPWNYPVGLLISPLAGAIAAEVPYTCRAPSVMPPQPSPPRPSRRALTRRAGTGHMAVMCPSPYGTADGDTTDLPECHTCKGRGHQKAEGPNHFAADARRWMLPTRAFPHGERGFVRATLSRSRPATRSGWGRSPHPPSRSGPPSGTARRGVGRLWPQFQQVGRPSQSRVVGASR